MHPFLTKRRINSTDLVAAEYREVLPNRLRLEVIVAWLGVIALGCNALIPVRFAFDLGLDLAHARQCGHYEGPPVTHDAGWWLRGLLAGQDQTADPLSSHNGFHPALSTPCGAIGTIAAFAPPPAGSLAIAVFKSALEPPRIEPSAPRLAFLAGYRSRAPPLA